MQTNIPHNVNGFSGVAADTKEKQMTAADWAAISESSAFKELIRQKRAFIIPATIFFLVFYFTLPVLTAFSTVLNGKVIGVINWAHLYAFSQFIMTWALCHLYLKKAKQFDELTKKIQDEI